VQANKMAKSTGNCIENKVIVEKRKKQRKGKMDRKFFVVEKKRGKQIEFKQSRPTKY
jgi:hypothetical protein